MNNFVNEFKPIQDALESRGFTLYDGDEPCFIAKYAKNAYVVIASDFEFAQIWYVNREITDDEFVKIVTGKDDAAFDKLYCDTYIVTVSLAWALGFRGVDPEIKFS